MEYAVGKYKIVPPKPFSSFEQAVEYIQKIYPELDTQTIEKHLTPKITKNGNDQSDHISEENSVSTESGTKTGSAGAKRVKSDADQPR